jgi:D-tyrosyl-tRNA(Tyr) deacylase
MRVLLQRVREASVSIDGQVHGRIGAGLLVLCGVRVGDGAEDCAWLARKIVRLRIFPDDAGVMNRSLADLGAAVLAVSQFTLYASTRKGQRPSYSAAAPPGLAAPLFAQFVDAVERELGSRIATGVFGADMQVALVNDGPVSLWLDSVTRE